MNTCLTAIKVSSQSNSLIIQHDILKTLLYFDIFNYPLHLEEIVNYSHFSSDEIQEELLNLSSNHLVYKINNFYSLEKEDSFVLKRVEENSRAKKMIKKASLFSRFISQFPFVRGVFISGSLSKGSFEKGDDIDYFIVTSPNRLWLARTILIFYKKVFLLNSKKYFCINYLMSTNALEIAEKNRFTATEFVTLIPMFGDSVYQDLQEKNTWILKYFPNYNIKNTPKVLKNTWLKQFLEFLFQGKLGARLDEKFMKITKKHQYKKFEELKNNDFEVAFKGDKNTSKHHPNNYQTKVVEALNNKIKKFNKKYSLEIPLES